MKEIIGAGGPSNLSDIAAQRQQRAHRGGANALAGAAAKLKRADNASLSIEGRAISTIRNLPEARTEEVNRAAKMVNDPDFDIDAAFGRAMDKLIDTL